MIVGGGPAGDAVAAGLRDGGFKGEVVIVGSEAVLPYERPHLSKGYLLGTVPRSRLGLRPADQYRELAIEVRLGQPVAEVDIERRLVALHSGEKVAWDLLCLTTGSTARRLPGFEEAIYLRELSDADRLRAELDGGSALNLVGAGFIGCEVASVARRRGSAVTVYEALDQPLQRVLGAELGAYLARVHRDHGVDLQLGAGIIPALQTPVVVGIGSVPRSELGERIGLTVDDGLVVDELGRTSAPDVFAAGDATRFWSPLYETRIRVEHFQTAQRHGFAVGRAMAGGQEPYGEVPWFWSDQYDLNLQYAGAGLPWDETVVRGKFGRPPFSVFYLSGGHMVAVAGLNDRHTVSRARHLMQARLDLTRSQLADPGFDLRRVLP